MADRYAYVSFVGLFIMVCWGVSDLAAERHLPRALLPAVSVVALVALTIVTYRQVGYWKDDISLWQHSAEVTTGNWKAEYMLGVAQDSAGLHDAAIQSWYRGAAINPTDPFTNLDIAMYEHRHMKLPLAIEYYKRVLPQAWNSEQRTQVLTNMAIAYRQLGDAASADACMSKITTLPQRKVDWQGAWWKQIIPMIKQYLHTGGSSQS
jgi:tetratricopeptide (TPR) repeat protein